MLIDVAPVMSAGLALQDSVTRSGVFADVPGDTAGLFGYMGLVCGFSILVLGLAIWIYIVLMMSMMKVPVEHRKMLPGLVWLNFIPCFNLFWSFFLAIWIPQSLDAALGSRAESIQTGRGVGMAWAVLNVVNTAISLTGQFIGSAMRATKIANHEVLTIGDFLPDLIWIPLGLVGVVCMVMFGLQVQRAARMLHQGADGSTMPDANEKW